MKLLTRSAVAWKIYRKLMQKGSGIVAAEMRLHGMMEQHGESSGEFLRSSFDAVLFDFDGVIVESAQIKTDAFRALFSGYPEHVDEIVALHKKHAGISRNIKFDMIYRDILHLPLADADRQNLADRFQQMVFEKVIACPVVPGVPPLLDLLASHVSLAVVSGTPESELIRIVRERDMASYFVSVNGSPRTKTEIINSMLVDNQWNPQRVLMIGDAIEDFNAASANGTWFVGRVAHGSTNVFPAGTAIVEDMTHLDSAVASLLRVSVPNLYRSTKP